MARIAGINIPPHKHTEIGLTAIYGIGRTTAQKICEKAGIEYSKKVKDLTDGDLEKIRDEISKMTIEGDLRRETPAVPPPGRPPPPLPVRGQRTRTNARTRKGPKKGAQALKK